VPPELRDLPLAPAGALRDLRPSAPGLAGMWRYRDCIPVSESAAARVTLSEGQTPLVDVDPELAGVMAKLEFLLPTGSFKDRGAAVLIASALERGADSVIADSSGNAGSAIAAYAARAGIDCTVYVPESTSPGKRRQILAYGAQLEVVAGDRTATAKAAAAAVEPTGATYASHVYDPYFLEGTKTIAYEIWEQAGDAPDAVIVPAGNGTLLLGIARGFAELLQAGLVRREPALIAVQSERCAPLARAWAEGSDEPIEVEAGDTAAEGIAIPRPPRGAQILAAVRHTGGCVVTVPEEAIAPAQAQLGRRGLFVEPTAALVWAAALTSQRHPALRGIGGDGPAWDEARSLASGPVVVPLCGSGLKSAGPLPGVESGP
jgi:threonine synthase